MEEHKEEHPEIKEEQKIETREESPTGGEIPKKVEQQPTQMFKAKKKDEEKINADNKVTWKERLWAYLRECKRVLKITKKPDREELKMIVKISGLGIIIIGMVGFVIHFVKELLF